MDPLKAGWTVVGAAGVALGAAAAFLLPGLDEPETVRIQPAAEQVLVTPSPSVTTEAIAVTTTTAAPIPAPVTSTTTSTTTPAPARTVETVTPAPKPAPQQTNPAGPIAPPADPGSGTAPTGVFGPGSGNEPPPVQP